MFSYFKRVVLAFRALIGILSNAEKIEKLILFADDLGRVAEIPGKKKVNKLLHAARKSSSDVRKLRNDLEEIERRSQRIEANFSSLELPSARHTVGSIEGLGSIVNSRGEGKRILDLGCGNVMRNPFRASNLKGIDICDIEDENILQANLVSSPIPFESSTFDFCTAFDFLAHLPRVVVDSTGAIRSPFIELMNEIHRVLKSGGLFLHQTPAYPAPQVFQDPTHVNFITQRTINNYFCGPNNYAKTLGYGFYGEFKLVESCWLRGSHLVQVITAVK